MIFSPTKEMVLTFAGLVQSGKLVSQLATEPQHDEAALRASSLSLLNMHPQNIEQVFGGVAGLQLGLNTMANLLQGKGLQTGMGKELIRYLMAMDQLADRLRQSSDTPLIIEKGLEELNSSYSALLHTDGGAFETSTLSELEAFYLSIGTLYQKSLSQLGPKIIVRGAQGYLQDQISVASVRVALFAGVRAAYLWHQQGGRRWHLLFSRRAYAQMAKRLLTA